MEPKMLLRTTMFPELSIFEFSKLDISIECLTTICLTWDYYGNFVVVILTFDWVCTRGSPKKETFYDRVVGCKRCV